MLSRRQTDIFMDFYTRPETYLRLKDLAEKYHISVRTVQSDISGIREALKDSGMTLESTASKGCVLHIKDQTKSHGFVRRISDAFTTGYFFEEQSSRVSWLLSKLLDSGTYVKSQDLADSMYVSRSTLSSDLHQLKKILEKYGLSLVSRPYYGLKIEGKETAIRQCIIKENVRLDMGLFSQPGQNSLLAKIREIAIPILLEMHFRISDVALQNLLIHILLSIERIKSGNIVEAVSLPSDSSYTHVYHIARQIMEACCRHFQLPCEENEIVLLTLNLHGKREYDSQEYLTDEIDRMVYTGLLQVKKDYNMDFTGDLDLRIALGLHLIPLRSRIHTNMPAENTIGPEIKMNYTLAFELAASFLSALPGDYRLVNDDEISYVALHFSCAMLNQSRREGKKNVLLISSQKKSDLILVQQKIKQWFVEISEVTIASLNEVNAVLAGGYDVILATDPEVIRRYPRARLINYFLTDQDYRKIELALSGFHSIDDILGKFDPDLFYHGPAKDKNEIIQILYKKAKEKYGLGENFLESLLHREETGSSRFNEFLAIPHPERPMSSHTFIAVGVLTEKIEWSRDFYVRLVFLVGLEQNNPQALQLWYYLSPLISSSAALQSLIGTPTYGQLIKTVTDVYRDMF